MGLTAYLAPIALALLALAAALAVRGVRRQSAPLLLAAAVPVLLLAAGCAVLLEFITRM